MSKQVIAFEYLALRDLKLNIRDGVLEFNGHTTDPATGITEGLYFNTDQSLEEATQRLTEMGVKFPAGSEIM